MVRGRKAEDGVIPAKYELTETKSRNYATRTRRNVRNSDGTLVLNLGELDGGTLQTVEYAEKRGKPCLVIQLDNATHPDPQMVAEWLKEQNIRFLNVAGPRESKRPGVYRQSFEFMERLLHIRL